MKAILRVSLILNLGFAIWVACLLLNERKPEPVPLPAENPSPQISQASTSIAVFSPESQPFRWSSVESTNYRTYIANLRGIECPEQTIRDIIKADVDALYASRREELKRKMDASIKASPDAVVFARDEFQRALDQLDKEEGDLIAALLGNGSPAMVVAASRSRQERPAEMPLVFQDVDPSAMHLTDSQAEIINEIRQDFLQQVGGLNQDPGDPAYRKRWLPAEREADDMLRGMLGSAFVQNYESHVAEPSGQSQ